MLGHLEFWILGLLALAARLETTRLVALDERHFRRVRPLTGEATFTLLPAGA
ncbi:MAG: hypothetical protein M3N18_05560 [Actinomycetota bacterium]|nr:hypothetical protein [Actinomycetota bacterium]